MAGLHESLRQKILEWVEENCDSLEWVSGGWVYEDIEHDMTEAAWLIYQANCKVQKWMEHNV